MQDTITCPIDQFDLDGFVEACREFYASWSGCGDQFDRSVCIMHHWDDLPMPNHEGRDVRELIRDGVLVYPVVA
jgi:hypothetical protein